LGTTIEAIVTTANAFGKQKGIHPYKPEQKEIAHD
jgi:hypothetical protein